MASVCLFSHYNNNDIWYDFTAVAVTYVLFKGLNLFEMIHIYNYFHVYLHSRVSHTEFIYKKSRTLISTVGLSICKFLSVLYVTSLYQAENGVMTETLDSTLLLKTIMCLSPSLWSSSLYHPLCLSAVHLHPHRSTRHPSLWQWIMGKRRL